MRHKSVTDMERSFIIFLTLALVMKHNSKYALFELLCFPVASWLHLCLRPRLGTLTPALCCSLPGHTTAAGVAGPRHASPGVRTPYKITIYAYL